MGSQENIVSVLSSPRAEQCRFRCLEGRETFSALQNVQNGYEPKPASHSVGNVKVKQPQSGTDHPQVKKE